MVTAAGCAQTVSGTAQRARPVVPDPERSYGYVDDRCGLLEDSSVQEMLGAENVVRPYSGAVCQYVLERDSGPDVGAGAPPATTIDVTFSWFETGNLDRERTLAEQRGAQITDKVVERHDAFLARRDATAVRRPRRQAPACSAGGCRSAESRTSTPARTPRSCLRARCRRTCDHVRHHVVPEALRRTRRCRRAGRGLRGAGPACCDPGARGSAAGGFESGECNNITDADITTAAGSSMFTKVVDNDAGCFWQENTMLGSFGAGMGISTWWYRGSDMDTERSLEQQAGRKLTELSIDGNKGFKAFDANACSIYVSKGGDVITWSIQTMNPASLPDLCGITGQLAQLSQERVN